jgi:hypothetical protein
MSAAAQPRLVTEEPQTRSRPSTAMNVIEGDVMVDEFREVLVKKQDLIARLHVLNQLEADLRLHLTIAGKI